MKTTVDFAPGITLIVTFQIGDILQQNISGTVICNDCADIFKEIPTFLFVLETLLLSGLTERLAREPSTQYIVGRNILRTNRCDVALDVTTREIDCVQFPQVGFKFAGKDTLVSESIQSKMETTYAGEQVNIA